MPKIAIVSGTSRANSRTRLVASLLHEIYNQLGSTPLTIDLAMVPAADCYVACDDDRAISPAVQVVIDRLSCADALHVVCPEYHGGMPGMLKLLLDAIPGSHDVIAAQPVALVGLASSGEAIRPVDQLRDIFGHRNAFLFPQSIYVSGAASKVGSRLEDIDPRTVARIRRQATRFVSFVEALRPLRCLFGERAAPRLDETPQIPRAYSVEAR